MDRESADLSGKGPQPTGTAEGLVGEDSFQPLKDDLMAYDQAFGEPCFVETVVTENHVDCVFPNSSAAAQTSDWLTSESSSKRGDEFPPQQDFHDAGLSTTDMREALLEDSRIRTEGVKRDYKEHMLELFFLDNGGNIMAYNTWKQKPNPIREEFLNQHKLEDDVGPVRPAVLKTVAQSTRAASVSTPMSPRAEGICSPPRLRSPTLKTRSQSRICRVGSAPAPSEEIAQQARHEAEIRQRMAELQHKHLSSGQRLAPVQEPNRTKTHWDYLLEEMQWLAGDFVKERRWKNASARKVT